MTVADLRHRMPNAEFVAWVSYYERKHKVEEKALNKAKEESTKRGRR